MIYEERMAAAGRCRQERRVLPEPPALPGEESDTKRSMASRGARASERLLECT
jgi:hypothetical protein